MSTAKITLVLLLISQLFICTAIAVAKPNLIATSQHQQQQPQPQQQQQQSQQLQPQIQMQRYPQAVLMNPYTRAWHELLLDLRQQMLTKSIKFDESFRHLLSESKLNLHYMFRDTYGIMYEQNTEIFTSMFERLEQYYANGEVKLTKSMEFFFEQLYKKIFQVLNMNKQFTPTYLECVTEQLAHLKPFKDVPDKLNEGIRHAFVAARTFVQALNGGIDVIKSIISLGQPAQCGLINEKLLKNSQIITFNNQQTTSLLRPPCLNFCEQVITKCIGRSYLEQLSEKWKAYVLVLDQLALKLSTSYNIETIIAPLDLQISEAIMNFQENGTNITNQVFHVCGGRPPSGPAAYEHGFGPESHLSMIRAPNNRLSRRAANFAPTSVLQNRNQNHHNNNNNNNQHLTSAMNAPIDPFTLGGHFKAVAKEKAVHPGSPLLHGDLTSTSQKSPLLIDEIRNYMLSTKFFWLTLPNAVCTSNYTLGPNANASTRNHKQQNCFQESFQLQDVNSDLRYGTEIQHQVNQLEIMSRKIENALRGDEIEWNAEPSTRHPSPANGGGRFPSTTPTTTTTTPEPDAEEPDDPTTDDYEPGSGVSEVPGGDEPGDDTTISDYEDDTTTDEEADEDSNSQSTSAPSDDISTPSISDDPIKVDPPSIDEMHNSIITPPEQTGAQKSSQTSSKLVINMESHLLLASLVSVVLLIVTRAHSYNQLPQIISAR